MIEPRMRTSLLVGGGLAAVYVAVALVCLFHTSAPDYILSAAPARTRWINLIPAVVLAVGLLVVGLVSRRWWQAPLAPVVLAAGSFWTLTWLMNLPRHIAEHEWTAARASEVATTVVTTSHVVLTAVVVVGWGLIRRGPWRWTLGLLPSAALVAVGELLADRFDPAPFDGSDTSFEGQVAWLSRELRQQGVAAIVITALVVVGCVWLCALAERHLPQSRPEPVGTLPPPPPTYVPPASVGTSYVADELRKLADLRDGGVLDDAEFQRQKGRLLEQ